MADPIDEDQQTAFRPGEPALATSVKRPTQQELIADLLEHEEVMDLVRDIARQGYFPNELLVAIRDGANTIVVEGNRRLAALKLLLNPELAPDNYQKRIRQHAAGNQHPIQKVQVVLAPSRNAAVPLIIARHNGEAVKALDDNHAGEIRAKQNRPRTRNRRGCGRDGT